MTTGTETAAGEVPAAVPPSSDAPRVEWALWYAEAHGWDVFPVYEMQENGAGDFVCACGDAACDTPGKHPRTANGARDATTDEEQIREWFARWPAANIGTPYPSVLDCDLPRDSDSNDGVAEWRKLEKKHGVVPGAAVARSGGGGLHVYFASGSPGGKVGKGLSMRGEGLYAVLPPSIHKSGHPYLWERPPLAGRPLPKRPAWLANRQKTATRKLKDKVESGERIPVNERHDAIAAYIGSLRRRNPSLSEEEARTLAHAFRLERCESPDEKESDVDDLVVYVYAKEPAEGDEPWDGPAPEGAALFDRVRGHLKRYMVMSEHELVVTTLYVALTWLFTVVDVCGYLRVMSPERRCGKSLLLTILRGLVRNPLPSGGMSEAALFRSLAEKPRTVLADEIGKVLAAAGKDRNSDMLRVYLNGFETGWPVQRVVGEGTNQTVVDFPVYGTKVLGGTGQLDDQILDRCWVVNLARKKRSDKVARYRRRDAGREATELRRQLEAWAASIEQLFVDARPDIPDALDDRGQDIAEPLLALADLAGGEWPAKARKAVVALRGGDVEDDSTGVQLLADIRAVWPPKTDTLPTRALLERLFECESSPWADWWAEKEITREQFGFTGVRLVPNRAAAMKLARTLRPFGVRPRTLDSSKGYHLADFKEPFERYLPTVENREKPANPPSTPSEVVGVVGTQQPSGIAGFSRSSEAPLSYDLETPLNPSIHAIPTTPTTSNPQEGGVAEKRGVESRLDFTPEQWAAIDALFPDESDDES